MKKEAKQSIIETYKTHEGDTGSAEVQIAIMTSRIKEMTEHLRIHKHDESTRRGLLRLVGQRRGMLAYLRKKDFTRYKVLVENLNLRMK